MGEVTIEPMPAGPLSIESGPLGSFFPCARDVVVPLAVLYEAAGSRST
jgi:hypothetical protein